MFGLTKILLHAAYTVRKTEIRGPRLQDSWCYERKRG